MMADCNKKSIDATISPRFSEKTRLKIALDDVFEAFQKYQLALIFGWQDIAQRYRRSRVGAFWLTINMAILIGSMGIIFSALFRSELTEYLPHVCAGMIVWGFITNCLSEGCITFSGSSGIILQVRMPLFTHVLRTLWRNMIIFFHNIVIFPIVALVVGHGINFYALLAIPGFLLVAANMLWMMLILAVLCARFRDMTQVVKNGLQVLFYATPIMWMAKSLPSGMTSTFIEINPFYHFVALVRDPLFGQVPDWVSWFVVAALAAVGWVAALIFFGAYRWRVAYWL